MYQDPLFTAIFVRLNTAYGPYFVRRPLRDMFGHLGYGNGTRTIRPLKPYHLATARSPTGPGQRDGRMQGVMGVRHADQGSQTPVFYTIERKSRVEGWTSDEDRGADSNRMQTGDYNAVFMDNADMRAVSNRCTKLPRSLGCPRKAYQVPRLVLSGLE